MKPQAPSSQPLKTKASGDVRHLSGAAGEVRLPGGTAGEVRLIGGQWKRSKLSVLNLPGLRPTPSRVRETLFNWLGQDLSGLRCVDAFAGSGALGFEAASRGATDVLLVEQNPQLIANLEANKTRLQAQQIRIQRGDGIAALRSLAPQGVDVIFLDPPFDSGLFLEAIQAAALSISAQGAIYLEASESWNEKKLEALGLHLIKQSKAGSVHFHLLQPISKT
jgi:16S rRNA (guanine966-N2)-methyltransferase